MVLEARYVKYSFYSVQMFLQPRAVITHFLEIQSLSLFAFCLPFSVIPCLLREPKLAKINVTISSRTEIECGVAKSVLRVTKLAFSQGPHLRAAVLQVQASEPTILESFLSHPSNYMAPSKMPTSEPPSRHLDNCDSTTLVMWLEGLITAQGMESSYLSSRYCRSAIHQGGTACTI